MAKLILTEQQFNCIIEESILSNILGKKMSKSVIKKCIAAGISLAALIGAIRISNNYTQEQKQELIQYAEAFSSQDSAKIEAVKEYIQYALNNKGYSMEALKLNPENLVRLSKKYDYDLALLLAQAHLESCFGMTPRAQRTNSVFSIGSYDDGRNLAQYNSQDESVESYIKIMNRDYLNNSKTPKDILEPGAFVNHNGHRYASDNNYEAKVNSIRNRILRMFPIIGQ